MSVRFGPLSRCRGCGKPMTFARTPTGKAMPVQPHPVPGGNVAVHRDRADQLVSRVLGPNAPAALPHETTTVHHAAVCPALATDRDDDAVAEQLSLLDETG